jgi:hypothetical protein
MVHGLPIFPFNHLSKLKCELNLPQTPPPTHARTRMATLVFLHQSTQPCLSIVITLTGCGLFKVSYHHLLLGMEHAIMSNGCFIAYSICRYECRLACTLSLDCHPGPTLQFLVDFILCDVLCPLACYCSKCATWLLIGFPWNAAVDVQNMLRLNFSSATFLNFRRQFPPFELHDVIISAIPAHVHHIRCNCETALFLRLIIGSR